MREKKKLTYDKLVAVTMKVRGKMLRDFIFSPECDWCGYKKFYRKLTRDICKRCGMRKAKQIRLDLYDSWIKRMRKEITDAIFSKPKKNGKQQKRK